MKPANNQSNIWDHLIRGIVQVCPVCRNSVSSTNAKPATIGNVSAQDNFAYSALGLYNLEPPAQRFGGATSIIRTSDLQTSTSTNYIVRELADDEPTELALRVLSKFDLGTNDALTQGV